MLGFPIALLTANAFEWYAHKVWLHEYPRKHRNSPFFTHIRHHKRARLNGFEDEGYAASMWKDQEMFNEKAALKQGRLFHSRLCRLGTRLSKNRSPLTHEAKIASNMPFLCTDCSIICALLSPVARNLSPTVNYFHISRYRDCKPP